MGCEYNCGLENVVGSYNSSSINFHQDYNAGAGKEGIDYLVEAESRQMFEPRKEYDGGLEEVRKEIYADNYRNKKRVTESYSHVMDDFLNPESGFSAFVGDAEELKSLVEEAFLKLTGRDFPDDVQLNLVDGKEMKKMHPKNVMGFAVNRKHLGLVSEIFIKKGSLDRMMLTIGHELGHVLTRRLSDEKNEEAKAFAFSLAWMKKIKEENIGNLSTAIQLDRPAENGVHNTALDFVLDLVNKGKEAIGVWIDIVKGLIRVEPNAKELF
ncbi:hypothetical protein GF361_03500 [Candidatus Woesearchaeota archaeon]|nr:hypothetical protein [Candidatus Woesearchaeota archaeon]